MKSIGELLSSIVADYENISSLPNPALLAKCEKIQETLKMIIQHHLMDVQMLVKEAGKARDQTTQTEMVLNFLHHLVSQFPHPVFAPSSAQCQSLPDDEKQKNIENYKGFISWTCASLLRLLSVPELEKIHPNILKLLITLLELIKTKNVPVFRFLLTEIIKLSAELNQVYEDEILSNSYSTTGKVQAELKTFSSCCSESNGNERKVPILVIESFQSLSVLRNQCNALLEPLICDICQFAPDHLRTVWCVALFQLEHGDFTLKASTFSILTSLLQYSGMSEHQILHYMIFCLASSIELAVSLLRDEENSLREVQDWKLFVLNLCKFMNQIFALSECDCVGQSEEKVEKSDKSVTDSHLSHLEHKISFSHLSSIAECLSSEIQLLGTPLPKTDTSDKEYMTFVGAVVQECRYIVSSTALTQQTVTPGRMHQIGLLFDWLLGYLSSNEHKQLHSGIIKFISEAIVCEILCHLKCSGKDCETQSFCIDEFPMIKKFVLQRKLLNEKVTDLCLAGGDNMQQCIDKLSTLLVMLESCASILIHLSAVTSSSQVHRQWLEYVINSLLSKDMAVNLMKSFLKCLNTQASNIAKSDIGSELYISLYSSCVKAVQMYFVIMHITLTKLSENRIPIENFSKTLTLPFVSIVSLPWIESLKLEDLGSDLAATGLQKSTLLPISISLRKAGLDIGSVSSLSEKYKMVLCDCLKSLALCSDGKYTRWRSMLLIKWALGEGEAISNTALTFLPVFIVKCNEIGGSIFGGILSHIRGLCKKMKSSSSHVGQMVVCNLLADVLKLLSGNCSLKVKSGVDLIGNRLCEVCQLYRPSVFSFPLEVWKGTWSSESARKRMKKPTKDLLENLTAIVTSLQSLMKSPTTSEQGDSGCIQVIKNICVKVVGSFLQLIKREMLSVDVHGILRQWIAELKIYTENDLEETFRSIVDEADLGSAWNTVMKDAVDDLSLKSCQEQDISTHIHCIHLCGLVGRYSLLEDHEFELPSLFFWSFRNLLTHLTSSVTLVQSAAFLELSNITSKSNSTWKDLFQSNRQEICLYIALSILGHEPCSGKRPPVEVLEDISHLLSVHLDDFLRLNVQFLLPAIISATSEPLLKLFSEVTGTSRVDILMQNFKHIFCHTVVKRHPLPSLFSFLEKETRIKKESLLLLNFGSLVHHVASYISVDFDQVSEALQVIAEVKSSSSSSKSSSAALKKVARTRADTSFHGLLQPHFLGILTFFNCQLRSSSVSGQEKKRILESLICLLQTMDVRDVTSVRVKIINTLCLAQQLYKHKKWLKTCCNAWYTFVKHIEPSSLAPLLNQVTVTILPMLEDLPDQVARVLEYLVVEKSVQTHQHLHELYYLPNHPSLKEVCNRINVELNKRDRDDLTTDLSQAVQLMNHESSEVRVQALTRLLQTLKGKQGQVQHHHLKSGRDVADPIMSQMVSTLLVGCRDNNKQIRLLCGQCLGLIGAIDPDRLSLNLPGSTSNTGDFFTIDDPNFAFNLISDLVKAFLAAKPTHQDISAFAIQELLKIYDCKDGPKDTHGRRLWRRFSENIQEVLEPHHSSRYLLKKSEIPLSNLKQPVLFRKSNMTFRDWAGSFCAVLMQMVYESSDTSTASKVFRSCSAVARNDLNIALFLLPHAYLQALLNTEHADFIVQEVMAILEQTDQLKDRTGTEPENDDRKGGSGTDLTSQETPTTSNMLINYQHARGSHLLQLGAQAIFSALDHVTRWLRHTEEGASEPRSKHTRNSSQISLMKSFLGRIPQLTLAQASFRCRAHTRALMHYEAHLRKKREREREGNPDIVDEQDIDFLQQLFVEMDEPDGVAGIAAVRLGKPTLSVQIKQLESTGALQDACACYERAIQINPDDLQHKRDYVKCLLDLGQLSTAVTYIDGTLTKKPSWKNDLNSYRIEAAWRLGRWDMLEEHLDNPITAAISGNGTPRSHDWNTRLGELLLVVRDNQWTKFKSLVDEIYQDQTGPLSAASMERGSYQRGYESILRLHMLTELESFAKDVNENENRNLMLVATRCYASWQERMKPVQTSFKAREPVLALQRTMLDLLCLASDKNTGLTERNESSVKKIIGRLWLETAKNARKAGYLQTSYNALINAQDLDLPEFCIEHAKWLWHKGESHQALLTLQKGVADHFPEEEGGPSTLSHGERMSKAKAMLLVARLMEESSSFDSNTVLKQFREVVVYMNEWEDSHFYAAKYYDKLMTAFMGDNRSSGKANHLYYIMHHYGLSLCYGTSHIYESLTKLLTVWLDYEANVAKLEKANKAYSKDDANKLINVITDLRGRLPAYIFLTAFSQLVSRICHQHLPTFEELKQVVAMVICAYPRQALWTMMAISKSSYPQRAQRCKGIFDLAESKNRKLAKLLSDATRLTDKLLELCNKPSQSIQSLSINTHFKPLKRMVEESSFSEILLPLQRFMTVTLPQDDVVSSSADGPSTSAQATTPTTRQHEPFPVNSVYIVGFEDTVEILPSLQRPKKISIRASDGRSYLFLCKPKDDLRKDARLMEFNAIVNKCLKRDSESRKRQLKIRTYAVLPLNEECGLIEWVPHTRGFRHILIQRYKKMSILCSNRELISYMVPKTASVQKKLDVFKNKLLPRHPPVFGDWFLATFPDPTSWYNARLAYARSTAVMSMVGYILGLGDRHGENILFDSTCGDAVHVDFNCLFNKGLSLDVPEIVPFRLTHNMTDAMGPMRHEGFFRCACEVVMRLLRQQREPLLSVLKTFIYDPLVEWSKRSRAGMANESGEIVNEKAVSHVSDIDKRLRGIAAKNKGLPLSVEGHVHYLIQEATEEEKLCQMYIGWAPYM